MTLTGADGILLVAFGARDELRPVLEEVRPRLAELLTLTPRDLPREALPERLMPALRQPPAEVPAETRRGWLAALPLDPGLTLPTGGCWAEVLGAWRQLTVAVLTESQLRTGLPAAGTALLRHWSVPLLGLIQWQGDWDEALRRREGLPWLGVLQAGGGDPQRSEEERLRTALRLRWQLLRSESGDR